MYRVLRSLILYCMVSPAFGQTAPVVSNVRAGQRGDASRLVDIYYDLSHSIPCTVWVVMSYDGGQTWDVPVRTLSGDVGNGITAGSNRRIVWDAAADIPGIVGDFRARVFADDSSAQGDMVFVPGGTFPVNNTWPLYVAPFWIDRFEVTNQRYCEFLNDADPDGVHWDAGQEITRTGLPPNVIYAVQANRQHYPVRYVKYDDALAFAAWLTDREGRVYRLPNSYEWEKAAAWDASSQRHWVWGFLSDTISCAWANHSGCAGTTTEVGHYGGASGTNDAHSYFGCYDMTGNVAEWISDGSGTTRYAAGGGHRTPPAGCGCCDCWCNLCTMSIPGQYHRSDNRDANARNDDLGFRLVLDPG